MGGREELRHTFDAAADTYHDARTRYPGALYDRLREVAGVGRGTTVLELGPATGVATEELAQGGAVITGIELGEQLVAQARRNLAAFADVDIVHGSFDSWEPPAWGSFDVVAAASCWHWMDPETRYQRAHRHLRPGGHPAHWSAGHVIPVDGALNRTVEDSRCENIILSMHELEICKIVYIRIAMLREPFPEI